MIICDYKEFKDFLEEKYPSCEEELLIKCDVLNFSIGMFKEEKEFFGMRMDLWLEKKHIELWVVNINYIDFFHSFSLSNNINFDNSNIIIRFDEDKNKYFLEFDETESEEPLLICFDKYYFIEN